MRSTFNPRTGYTIFLKNSELKKNFETLSLQPLVEPIENYPKRMVRLEFRDGPEREIVFRPRYEVVFHDRNHRVVMDVELLDVVLTKKDYEFLSREQGAVLKVNRTDVDITVTITVVTDEK